MRQCCSPAQPHGFQTGVGGVMYNRSLSWLGSIEITLFLVFVCCIGLIL